MYTERPRARQTWPLLFAVICLAFALVATTPLLPSAGATIVAVDKKVQTARLLESENETLLQNTEAPARDLISLTQRLKLGGRPLSVGAVSPTQPEYAIGTKHRFFVIDVVQKGYSAITATIQVVTPHAYWYVQDGTKVNRELLAQSAAHFERRIYPTNVSVFGPDPGLGIDNDPRITVLIATTPGAGGYFSPIDTYPRAVNQYSNERDILYIGSTPTRAAGDPSNWFESTVAHELQHMLHWHNNATRDIWLDEGCSQIASYLNGYTAGLSHAAFLRAPDTQLNTWNESGKNLANYGASYLFLRFLMDRYGGQDVISRVLKAPGATHVALDGALAQTPDGGSSFDEAFSEWVVANVNTHDRSAPYGYAEAGQVTQMHALTQRKRMLQDTVSQYAADYIKLTPGADGSTVTFTGNATVPIIDTEPRSGYRFWYSNRRDAGDATLTREFDLTGVRRATLQFRAWYDIEYAYDYGYIMASTNGGQSWTPLKGNYTTLVNPNGLSYGPGWTGRSGWRGDSKARPKWISERVDLSAYAGQRILLRFEYISDEGYNRPGLALDDIKIPEIGYSDDAEWEMGWTAEGFVRIGSRLPQEWYLAVVTRGSSTAVREIPVSSSGRTTFEIPAALQGAEIILVVAPLAPKTTERATYKVELGNR